ncbi:hypothetical protein [Fictibacillus sp. 26RED30]|uniref:hypothetical protein n=1 Tax=Fictibacillus sp. 26RED30 TaxID=2745877 RepID=UPI0018CCCE51|nr:hypothetical protein [Fictibacillus sp. 26RED30]MBH0161366.1 hypothetical protein [Fictibacillus sp. 26RED30]
MKNPVVIYTILLFSMFSLLVVIDWFLGIAPATVIKKSFMSFFHYVDKVEYVLVITLMILPILTFILSKWMEKKQKA